MIQEKFLMMKIQQTGLILSKFIVKIILLSGLYSVSVSADIRKVESCLVSTSQKCDVKLTYFEENIDVSVGVSKDAVYSEEYMGLLNQYYLYAKANNFKKLISLYGAEDVGVNSTANISDQCPSASCFGYKMAEAKALAEMELKFLVVGVFEGSYALKHETVFWDGYSESCN